MFIYTDENVFDAAKKRISFLFDEFETVVVSMSGGKDSCVVYNLCMEEAERRGRLPLPVVFLDQEAEWQMTIDYMRKIMYDPRVKPYWLQCPVKLFNATSHEKDNWLFCWRDGDNWMREKEPIAIKENKYGTDRFAKLLDRVIEVEYEGIPVANVAGIRCEESPGRRAGLTGLATYKYVTWGAVTTKDHYVFSPIYDWSYTDVWKAIFDNGWEYNRVYDYFYRYGVPVTRMRVSNLNHETAVSSLYHLQEIEPDYV